MRRAERSHSRDTDATARARPGAARRSCGATARPNYRAHGRFLDAVAEALPGRHRGRRFDPAGLRRQPVLRAGAGRAPGSIPRTGYGTLGYGLPAAIGAKLACPRPPGRGADRRRRHPVHHRRAGDGGGAGLGAADPALEQPGLRRDQAVHARPRHPARSASTSTRPTSRPSRAASAAAPSRSRALAHLREELRKAHAAKRPTVIEIDDAAAQRWWGSGGMTSRVAHRARRQRLHRRRMAHGRRPADRCRRSLDGHRVRAGRRREPGRCRCRGRGGGAAPSRRWRLTRGARAGRLSARHRARRRGAARRSSRRCRCATAASRAARRRSTSPTPSPRSTTTPGWPRSSTPGRAPMSPLPDAGIRRQDAVRAGRAGRHDRALELPAGHLAPGRSRRRSPPAARSC